MRDYLKIVGLCKNLKTYLAILLKTSKNTCVPKKNWCLGEREPPKVVFKKESEVEHTKPQLSFWHLSFWYLKSTNIPILNEGKKRTWTVTCNIEGVTLYWHDFDEFNLDGYGISPRTHAQQGTLITKNFGYLNFRQKFRTNNLPNFLCFPPNSDTCV